MKPCTHCGGNLGGFSPSGNLTSQRGVSLLQLLLGLQLFGIITLATAPVVSQVLQSYYLRGAAAQVFADLQKARMNAVMANHRYRLVVIDSHTYKLHDDTNGNGIEDPGETVQTRSVQMDSPHVMLAATGAITFAADGSAPTYGTITVSNESGCSQSLNIEVGAAGRTRIQQPTG